MGELQSISHRDVRGTLADFLMPCEAGQHAFPSTVFAALITHAEKQHSPAMAMDHRQTYRQLYHLYHEDARFLQSNRELYHEDEELIPAARRSVGNDEDYLRYLSTEVEMGSMRTPLLA